MGTGLDTTTWAFRAGVAVVAVFFRLASHPHIRMVSVIESFANRCTTTVENQRWRIVYICVLFTGSRQCRTAVVESFPQAHFGGVLPLDHRLSATVPSHNDRSRLI